MDASDVTDARLKICAEELARVRAQLADAESRLRDMLRPVPSLPKFPVKPDTVIIFCRGRKTFARESTPDVWRCWLCGHKVPVVW